MTEFARHKRDRDGKGQTKIHKRESTSDRACGIVALKEGHLL